MNLKLFKKNYEGASWDDEELAQAIVDELDPREPLYKAAQEFVKAHEKFFAALDKEDFERG